MIKLNKVKTQEYKYPYQVYKMPVQAGLFNHLIMATLLKMAKPGFGQHHDIDNHATEYVKAMEAGNAEEVRSESSRTGSAHIYFIEVDLADEFIGIKVL